MRFLQTSDWHLGKSFHEMSLQKDQEFFLDQIYMELKKGKDDGNPYKGLLVPGDIYDRPIPPSEAVTLLSSFLAKLHNEFPELEIFMLSGNHDSADRLSFLKDILSKMKIHIATDVKDFTEPVILEDGNDSCAVYQLPFLYSGSFFDENGNSIKKQDDLYKFSTEKIVNCHKENYSDSSSILCVHLMTVKSFVSDSERSFVGTAEEVNASYFDSFDHIAAGHLHSFQKAGELKKVVYSGSPLAYSFDDKGVRVMLSIEVKKNKKTKITPLEIKPLHPVCRLKGPFEKFYGPNKDKGLVESHAEDYVEIFLTDSVVPEGAVSLLRSSFKNLLSLRQESKEDSVLNPEMSKRSEAVKSNNPEKIFEGFFREVYGNSDSEEYSIEKKLFLQTAKENDWEASE